jgi:molybdopterin synthase catalytic subunit
VTRPHAIIDVCLVDGPVESIAVDPFPAAAGAECIFLGRTRAERHPRFGDLQRLSYEAYGPMALRILTDLAEEAARRFGCLAVRMHHAVGDVSIGQASVLVQVVCGHRAEAIDACRFLIDALKASAPIWKREVWAHQSTWSEGASVAAMKESTA